MNPLTDTDEPVGCLYSPTETVNNIDLMSYIRTYVLNQHHSVVQELFVDTVQTGMKDFKKMLSGDKCTNNCSVVNSKKVKKKSFIDVGTALNNEVVALLAKNSNYCENMLDKVLHLADTYLEHIELKMHKDNNLKQHHFKNVWSGSYDWLVYIVNCVKNEDIDISKRKYALRTIFRIILLYGSVCDVCLLLSILEKQYFSPTLELEGLCPYFHSLLVGGTTFQSPSFVSNSGTLVNIIKASPFIECKTNRENQKGGRKTVCISDAEVFEDDMKNLMSDETIDPWCIHITICQAKKLLYRIINEYTYAHMYHGIVLKVQGKLLANSIPFCIDYTSNRIWSVLTSILSQVYHSNNCTNDISIQCVLRLINCQYYAVYMTNPKQHISNGIIVPRNEMLNHREILLNILQDSNKWSDDVQYEAACALSLIMRVFIIDDKDFLVYATNVGDYYNENHHRISYSYIFSTTLGFYTRIGNAYKGIYVQASDIKLKFVSLLSKTILFEESKRLHASNNDIARLVMFSGVGWCRSNILERALIIIKFLICIGFSTEELQNVADIEEYANRKYNIHTNDEYLDRLSPNQKLRVVAVLESFASNTKLPTRNNDTDVDNDYIKNTWSKVKQLYEQEDETLHTSSFVQMVRIMLQTCNSILVSIVSKDFNDIANVKLLNTMLELDNGFIKRIVYPLLNELHINAFIPHTMLFELYISLLKEPLMDVLANIDVLMHKMNSYLAKESASNDLTFEKVWNICVLTSESIKNFHNNNDEIHTVSNDNGLKLKLVVVENTWNILCNPSRSKIDETQKHINNNSSNSLCVDFNDIRGENVRIYVDNGKKIEEIILQNTSSSKFRSYRAIVTTSRTTRLHDYWKNESIIERISMELMRSYGAFLSMLFDGNIVKKTHISNNVSEWIDKSPLFSGGTTTTTTAILNQSINEFWSLIIECKDPVNELHSLRVDKNVRKPSKHILPVCILGALSILCPNRQLVQSSAKDVATYATHAVFAAIMDLTNCKELLIRFGTEVYDQFYQHQNHHEAVTFPEVPLIIKKAWKIAGEMKLTIGIAVGNGMDTNIIYRHVSERVQFIINCVLLPNEGKTDSNNLKSQTPLQRAASVEIAKTLTRQRALSSPNVQEPLSGTSPNLSRTASDNHPGLGRRQPSEYSSIRAISRILRQTMKALRRLKHKRLVKNQQSNKQPESYMDKLMTHVKLFVEEPLKSHENFVKLNEINDAITNVNQIYSYRLLCVESCEYMLKQLHNEKLKQLLIARICEITNQTSSYINSNDNNAEMPSSSLLRYLNVVTWKRKSILLSSFSNIVVHVMDNHENIHTSTHISLMNLMHIVDTYIHNNFHQNMERVGELLTKSVQYVVNHICGKEEKAHHSSIQDFKIIWCVYRVLLYSSASSSNNSRVNVRTLELLLNQMKSSLQTLLQFGDYDHTQENILEYNHDSCDTCWNEPHVFAKNIMYTIYRCCNCTNVLAFLVKSKWLNILFQYIQYVSSSTKPRLHIATRITLRVCCRVLPLINPHDQGTHGFDARDFLAWLLDQISLASHLISSTASPSTIDGEYVCLFRVLLSSASWQSLTHSILITYISSKIDSKIFAVLCVLGGHINGVHPGVRIHVNDEVSQNNGMILSTQQVQSLIQKNLQLGEFCKFRNNQQYIWQRRHIPWSVRRTWTNTKEIIETIQPSVVKPCVYVGINEENTFINVIRIANDLDSNLIAKKCKCINLANIRTWTCVFSDNVLVNIICVEKDEHIIECGNSNNSNNNNEVIVYDFDSTVTMDGFIIAMNNDTGEIRDIGMIVSNCKHPVRSISQYNNLCVDVIMDDGSVKQNVSLNHVNMLNDGNSVIQYESMDSLPTLISYIAKYMAKERDTSNPLEICIHRMCVQVISKIITETPSMFEHVVNNDNMMKILVKYASTSVDYYGFNPIYENIPYVESFVNTLKYSMLVGDSVETKSINEEQQDDEKKYDEFQFRTGVAFPHLCASDSNGQENICVIEETLVTNVQGSSRIQLSSGAKRGRWLYACEIQYVTMSSPIYIGWARSKEWLNNADNNDFICISIEKDTNDERHFCVAVDATMQHWIHNDDTSASSFTIACILDMSANKAIYAFGNYVLDSIYKDTNTTLYPSCILSSESCIKFRWQSMDLIPKVNLWKAYEPVLLFCSHIDKDTAVSTLNAYSGMTNSFSEEMKIIDEDCKGMAAAELRSSVSSEMTKVSQWNTDTYILYGYGNDLFHNCMPSMCIDDQLEVEDSERPILFASIDDIQRGVSEKFSSWLRTELMATEVSDVSLPPYVNDITTFTRGHVRIPLTDEHIRVLKDIIHNRKESGKHNNKKKNTTTTVIEHESPFVFGTTDEDTVGNEEKEIKQLAKTSWPIEKRVQFIQKTFGAVVIAASASLEYNHNDEHEEFLVNLTTSIHDIKSTGFTIVVDVVDRDKQGRAKGQRNEEALLSSTTSVNIIISYIVDGSDPTQGGCTFEDDVFENPIVYSGRRAPKNFSTVNDHVHFDEFNERFGNSLLFYSFIGDRVDSSCGVIIDYIDKSMPYYSINGESSQLMWMLISPPKKCDNEEYGYERVLITNNNNNNNGDDNDSDDNDAMEAKSVDDNNGLYMITINFKEEFQSVPSLLISTLCIGSNQNQNAIATPIRITKYAADILLRVSKTTNIRSGNNGSFGFETQQANNAGEFNFDFGAVETAHAASTFGFGGTAVANTGFGFATTTHTTGFGTDAEATNTGFGFGFGTEATNNGFDFDFGAGTEATNTGFGFGTGAEATNNGFGFGAGTGNEAAAGGFDFRVTTNEAANTSGFNFGSPNDEMATKEKASGFDFSATSSQPLLRGSSVRDKDKVQGKRIFIINYYAWIEDTTTTTKKNEEKDNNIRATEDKKIVVCRVKDEACLPSCVIELVHESTQEYIRPPLRPKTVLTSVPTKRVVPIVALHLTNNLSLQYRSIENNVSENQAGYSLIFWAKRLKNNNRDNNEAYVELISLGSSLWTLNVCFESKLCHLCYNGKMLENINVSNEDMKNNNSMWCHITLVYDDIKECVSVFIDKMLVVCCTKESCPYPEHLRMFTNPFDNNLIIGGRNFDGYVHGIVGTFIKCDEKTIDGAVAADLNTLITGSILKRHLSYTHYLSDYDNQKYIDNCITLSKDVVHEKTNVCENNLSKSFEEIKVDECLNSDPRRGRTIHTHAALKISRYVCDGVAPELAYMACNPRKKAYKGLEELYDRIDNVRNTKLESYCVIMDVKIPPMQQAQPTEDEELLYPLLCMNLCIIGKGTGVWMDSSGHCLLYIHGKKLVQNCEYGDVSVQATVWQKIAISCSKVHDVCSLGIYIDGLLHCSFTLQPHQYTLLALPRFFFMFTGNTLCSESFGWPLSKPVYVRSVQINRRPWFVEPIKHLLETSESLELESVRQCTTPVLDDVQMVSLVREIQKSSSTKVVVSTSQRTLLHGLMASTASLSWYVRGRLIMEWLRSHQTDLDVEECAHILTKFGYPMSTCVGVFKSRVNDVTMSNDMVLCKAVLDLSKNHHAESTISTSKLDYAVWLQPWLSHSKWKSIDHPCLRIRSDPSSPLYHELWVDASCYKPTQSTYLLSKTTGDWTQNTIKTHYNEAEENLLLLYAKNCIMRSLNIWPKNVNMTLLHECILCNIGSLLRTLSPSLMNHNIANVNETSQEEELTALETMLIHGSSMSLLRHNDDINDGNSVVNSVRDILISYLSEDDKSSNIIATSLFDEVLQIMIRIFYVTTIATTNAVINHDSMYGIYSSIKLVIWIIELILEVWNQSIPSSPTFIKKFIRPEMINIIIQGMFLTIPTPDKDDESDGLHHLQLRFAHLLPRLIVYGAEFSNEHKTFLLLAVKHLQLQQKRNNDVLTMYSPLLQSLIDINLLLHTNLTALNANTHKTRISGNEKDKTQKKKQPSMVEKPIVWEIDNYTHNNNDDLIMINHEPHTPPSNASNTTVLRLPPTTLQQKEDKEYDGGEETYFSSILWLKELQDIVELMKRFNEDVSKKRQLPLWFLNLVYTKTDLYEKFIGRRTDEENKTHEVMTAEKLQAHVGEFTRQMDIELVELINRYYREHRYDSGCSISMFKLEERNLNLCTHIRNIKVPILLARVAILHEFNVEARKLVAFADLSLKPGNSVITDAVRCCSPLYLSCIWMESFSQYLRSTEEASNIVNEVVIDRFKASSIRDANGVDKKGKLTVFGQVFHQLRKCASTSFRRFYGAKVWNVRLSGEFAQDAGGPFRESITDMCRELQSTQLELFTLCPNAVADVGSNRDRYVPLPSTSRLHNRMFFFVGQLMGMSLRTGNLLSLRLPSIVYKSLNDTPLDEADIEATDVLAFSVLKQLEQIANTPDITPEKFNECTKDVTWIVSTVDNEDRELIPNGENISVTYETRHAFAHALKTFKLNEYREPCDAMRRGLSSVIPIYTLSLLSWNELEYRICGNPKIEIEELRQITRYQLCDENAEVIRNFWIVLAEFNYAEREKFLEFVWSRSRLPLSSSSEAAEMIIKAIYDYDDAMLPKAHTCFFTLDLPNYSNKNVMKEKLLYAITHCGSIDDDNTGEAFNAAASFHDEYSDDEDY